MSIKHMTDVWENSPYSGSKLLLLLAYADFANDHGISWPSASTLAQRARISERQVRRLRQELYDAGDLMVVDAGGGRGNTDTVKLLLSTEKADAMSPFEAQNSDQMSPITQEKADKMSPNADPKTLTSSAQRVTSGTETLTPSALNPDIAMSPDPLDPPIDPSLDPRESTRAHAMHPASNGKEYPVILDDPPPRIPVSEKAGRKPRRRGHLTKFGIDPRRLVGGRIPEGQGTDPVEVFLEFNTVDKLNEPRADDMRRYVTDLERWRAVCRNWSLTYGDDWRKYGHMDWYLEDRRNGQPKASERNPVTANRTAARQSALGRQYEPGSPEWYEAKRKRGLL